MAQKRRPKGSGSVRKTKTGYIAQYTAPPGSHPARPSKSFKLQKDAIAWLDDQQQAIRQGQHVDKSKITVAEWMLEFAETYQQRVAESTKVTNAGCHNRLVKTCPELMMTALQLVTVPQIQKAVNQLEDNYHCTTVQLTVSKLKQALKKAAAVHVRPPLDLSELVVSKGKAKRGGRYIPAAEMDKLMDYCQTPGRAQATKDMILLISQTGMRTQEARALHRGDIDDHTVIVRAAISSRGNLKDPKTLNSYRRVPLPPESLAMIQRRLETCPDIIFNSSATGGYIAHTTIHNAIGNAIPGYAPHDLRHTYITNALRAGVRPEVVARLVGDTVEMIMRVYVHVNQDDLDQAVQMMQRPKVLQFEPAKKVAE